MKGANTNRHRPLYPPSRAVCLPHPSLYPTPANDQSVDRWSLEPEYMHPGSKDSLFDSGNEELGNVMNVYTGGCHCGAVTVAVRSRSWPEVEVRDDNCSICRRVGLPSPSFPPLPTFPLIYSILTMGTQASTPHAHSSTSQGRKIQLCISSRRNTSVTLFARYVVCRFTCIFRGRSSRRSGVRR
jgi:hypothetical protein